MPKISVYLPDDLYAEARASDLPISALTQEAVRTALRARRTHAWVARVRDRPPRSSADIDTASLIDEVRSEFGT